MLIILIWMCDVYLKRAGEGRRGTLFDMMMARFGIWRVEYIHLILLIWM